MYFYGATVREVTRLHTAVNINPLIKARNLSVCLVVPHNLETFCQIAFRLGRCVADDPMMCMYAFGHEVLKNLPNFTLSAFYSAPASLSVLLSQNMER